MVTLIDSVFRVGKNYNPQVFLEECKYAVIEKKMRKYITEDLEIYSSDKISDEENSDKENSDQESVVKKKMSFWESNFKNVFFEGLILEIYFLREQF